MCFFRELRGSCVISPAPRFLEHVQKRFPNQKNNMWGYVNVKWDLVLLFSLMRLKPLHLHNIVWWLFYIILSPHSFGVRQANLFVFMTVHFGHLGVVVPCLRNRGIPAPVVMMLGNAMKRWWFQSFCSGFLILCHNKNKKSDGDFEIWVFNLAKIKKIHNSCILKLSTLNLTV